MNKCGALIEGHDRRKPDPVQTVFSSKLTWAKLGLNPGPCYVRPTTNILSHDRVSLCYCIKKLPTGYLAKWNRHAALKCRYQTNLRSVTTQNIQDVNCTAAKAWNLAPYISLPCNNAHSNFL